MSYFMLRFPIGDFPSYLLMEDVIAEFLLLPPFQLVSDTAEDLIYIILAGIISFFIIRLVLKGAQGVIVNTYDLPNIFRSYALLPPKPQPTVAAGATS
ncbi:MAG: hypothetical protein WBZ36_19905 [Candidatus Nitrosopolaris sp.]